MNPNEPRDPELSRLLQAWQVQLPDDPALAAKVWRRLGPRAAPPWQSWWGRLEGWLAQPAAAFAAFALFAAVGALTAELQGSARREARLDRLATEYAHSIDPILMSNAPVAGHTP